MRAIGLCGTVAVGLLGILIATRLTKKRRLESLSYGVVLDAGSSGTRAHVGVFRPAADPSKDPTFADAHYFEIRESLTAASHSSDPPKSVAKIVSELLHLTRDVIPQSKRDVTPIFCRATAGLRLLGVQRAEEILGLVFIELQDSEFVSKRSWVSILDEANEGLHAWLTVNFLMGNIGTNNTVATLDLGGGSVQIAYEVASDQTAVPAPSVHQLPADDHTHHIFTKSFLGYGLLDFRRQVFKSLEDNFLLSDNPCINRGAKVDALVDLEGNRRTSIGTGDFDACLAQVKMVFKSQDFEAAPARPENARVVAFAYFYDRATGAGLPEFSHIGDIAARGASICRMTETELRHTHPLVPNGDSTDLCLDLAYIYVLMDQGFRLGPDSRTQFTQHVNGHMLGWAIGSLFSEIKQSA